MRQGPSRHASGRSLWRRRRGRASQPRFECRRDRRGCVSGVACPALLVEATTAAASSHRCVWVVHGLARIAPRPDQRLCHGAVAPGLAVGTVHYLTSHHDRLLETVSSVCGTSKLPLENRLKWPKKRRFPRGAPHCTPRILWSKKTCLQIYLAPRRTPDRRPSLQLSVRERSRRYHLYELREKLLQIFLRVSSTTPSCASRHRRGRHLHTTHTGPLTCRRGAAPFWRRILPR